MPSRSVPPRCKPLSYGRTRGVGQVDGVGGGGEQLLLGDGRNGQRRVCSLTWRSERMSSLVSLNLSRRSLRCASRRFLGTKVRPLYFSLASKPRTVLPDSLTWRTPPVCFGIRSLMPSRCTAVSSSYRVRCCRRNSARCLGGQAFSGGTGRRLVRRR